MLIASVLVATRVSPAKMCLVGRLPGSRTKYWLTYQESPAVVIFLRRSPVSSYLNCASEPLFCITCLRRFSSSQTCVRVSRLNVLPVLLPLASYVYVRFFGVLPAGVSLTGVAPCGRAAGYVYARL